MWIWRKSFARHFTNLLRIEELKYWIDKRYISHECEKWKFMTNYEKITLKLLDSTWWTEMWNNLNKIDEFFKIQVLWRMWNQVQRWLKLYNAGQKGWVLATKKSILKSNNLISLGSKDPNETKRQLYFVSSQAVS